MNASQLFSGVLCQLHEHGLDVTKHKTAIGAEDMDTMYSSGVLGDHSPEALQNKVFVEPSLHFGRHGHEGLHELKKNAIIFQVNDISRVCE